MAERIFISYRRDDSAGHAGRVFDRLRGDFGQDVLFMDVDAIPLGANFVRVLREEVAKCSALLAIIGPNWLNAKDDDGTRRLDSPTDFVRVEIAAALQRDIPVIPILLEGARIPKASALPDDLKELSERNGLDVRHASFHADMDKLVRGLRGARSVSGAASSAVKPAAPSIVPAQAALLRLPTLSVEDVIAARGQWVKDFGVDLTDDDAPNIFGHHFMSVVSLPDDSQETAGSILVGRKWQSTVPHWNVVHGYCDKSGWAAAGPSLLSYLGPTWLPEYTRLSDAVFNKLGAKRLARFIKHP